MRKIVFAISSITLSLLLTANKADAQQWSWVSGSSGNIKPATGALDVTIPSNKLVVTNDIISTNGTVKGYNLQATNIIHAQSDITSVAGTVKGYNIQGTNGIYSDNFIQATGNITTTWGTIKGYNVKGTNGVYSDGIIVATGDIESTSGRLKTNGEINGYSLVINADGWLKTGLRVGPTAVNPPGYRLAVEGGIITEKLKVAVSGTAQWSDYVFADNYELMPLAKLEDYINENNHLPEIPSATEVVKDGINVATMDAKLLQKIEELTLYVIDQQKQIEALKSKLNK